jgi:hypothetical protein
MKRFPPSKVAGLLSLLAALLVLGVWFILLFVAQPEGVSAIENAIGTARYVLFEEQSTRRWFIWLAIVPVLSVAIGACYLLGLARTKGFAITLFILAAALGASSFVLFDWSLALWVALPSYWGFLCVRQA